MLTVLPQQDLIPDRTGEETAQSGKLLAVAIVGAALVALLVLAAYLLFINREERRYFADSVKEEKLVELDVMDGLKLFFKFEHQPSKLDTWVRFPSPAPANACGCSAYAPIAQQDRATAF